MAGVCTAGAGGFGENACIGGTGIRTGFWISSWSLGSIGNYGRLS